MAHRPGRFPIGRAGVPRETRTPALTLTRNPLEALEHKSTIKAPYTILPGSIGGVLTNLALAGESLYVVTCDIPLTYTSLNQPVPTKPAGRPTGEVEALDLATGKVEWDTKVNSFPLGAATVSNDLVFTTLLNGRLIALNRHTGAIVYHRQLPTTSNAPIAIAGHAVLVPAGGITGKRAGTSRNRSWWRTRTHNHAQS
jgi:hypothetical protein